MFYRQVFSPIVAIFILFSFSLSLDLKEDDNMVAYWGQDGCGQESSLGEYCNGTEYDVIIASFLDVFFDHNSMNPDGVPLPNVDFSDHCSDTQPKYPSILLCPEIAEDINRCQENGKTILLSVGGSAGDYGFSSTSQAVQFANTIWNMFLGGSDPNYPRVFPNAILDGVDLDIEGGSSDYYADFVNALQQHTSNQKKSYYVSGAPQCPFPDAYLGPTPSSTALGSSTFDFINIQFYNNYCSVSDPSQFNFDQWASFFGNATVNQNIKIMIGAPAAPAAAGSGYVDPYTLFKLYSNIRSSNSASYLGGIMLWDAGFSAQNQVCGGISFGQCISNLIKN